MSDQLSASAVDRAAHFERSASDLFDAAARAALMIEVLTTDGSWVAGVARSQPGDRKPVLRLDDVEVDEADVLSITLFRPLG